MRNILGNILVCCLLSLFCPAFASAQTSGYDRALDKYAYICDRCVEMRDRARSGQSVSEASLKSLLEELAALRKTLSGASGKMSSAQLARFEEIKARYRSGIMSSAEDQAKRSGKHAAASIQRLAPLPVAAARRSLMPLPAAGPVETPGKFGVRHSLHDTSAGSVSGKSVTSIGSLPREKDARGSVSGRNVASRGLEVSVLADAGIFPIRSFGAAIVATWDGVGAYVNYRSDFSRNGHSYSCSSDGTTEYGRIWTTGRSRESRAVATAGLAMFTSRRFGFRLGAGLTSYTRCWEDVSGQWAKVSDKSFSGFAVDGGIFLAFRPLLVSVGVTSDFLGHADLQFGVGLCF